MGSAGHSGRVAACVSAYCDYAGISGAEKEAEVTLAKIHDIGKSGVVSGAMRPVERIAEADMTDMQYVFYSKAKPMHETYGAQLAADAGAPADIVNDVATHGGLTPQTSGRAIRLQIFDALDTKFRFYTWGGPADSWIAAALKFRPAPWQVEEWSRIKPWIMGGGLDGIPVPVGGY